MVPTASGCLLSPSKAMDLQASLMQVSRIPVFCSFGRAHNFPRCPPILIFNILSLKKNNHTLCHSRPSPRMKEILFIVNGKSFTGFSQKTLLAEIWRPEGHVQPSGVTKLREENYMHASQDLELIEVMGFFEIDRRPDSGSRLDRRCKHV